jgi:hypothetical protein
LFAYLIIIFASCFEWVINVLSFDFLPAHLSQYQPSLNPCSSDARHLAPVWSAWQESAMTSAGDVQMGIASPTTLSAVIVDWTIEQRGLPTCDEHHGDCGGGPCDHITPSVSSVDQ